MPQLLRPRTIIVASVFTLLLSFKLYSAPDSSSSPVPTIRRVSPYLASFFSRSTPSTTSNTTATARSIVNSTMPATSSHEVVSQPAEWQAELAKLPSLEETGGAIPSIFLAHGQPLLIWPSTLSIGSSGIGALAPIQGPKGSLANFLKDLGPALLEKYSPKAIVVFSAHFETGKENLVTDYGDDNPLLMDFFGFPDELYQTKFKSAGDHALSERIVNLLKESKIPARLTTKLEKRGQDGRGFEGPGFDHGVFVPFIKMFGDKSPIPIVQVSIDSTLAPEAEYALGAALEPLRSEGILIISGGLTIHTFRDFDAFSPLKAKEPYKNFEQAIVDAVAVDEPEKRKKALFNLIYHPAFRLAHPREEHFVPLYIAAGAAAARPGDARVLFGAHGAKTVVFGV